HASWQQEVWAAIERSRKHTVRWMNGLIDTENVDADVLIVASGTAVSQSREAIDMLEEEGVHVGLVKIKTLRPWPGEEIREATKHAKHIIIPEFNVTGWLAREVRATLPDSQRVHAGPHVCGGMTMPPEIISSEIKILLGIKTESLVGRG
ncbi:MAG: transketolase C-terminal domain-containing protein, partial [Nitrospirota bacterium]|nr:transketolase C-terminal domain-containing protein [Nitrospirota bacterium]